MNRTWSIKTVFEWVIDGLYGLLRPENGNRIKEYPHLEQEYKDSLEQIRRLTAQRDDYRSRLAEAYAKARKDKQSNLDVDRYDEECNAYLERLDEKSRYREMYH